MVSSHGLRCIKYRIGQIWVEVEGVYMKDLVFFITTGLFLINL